MRDGARRRLGEGARPPGTCHGHTRSADVPIRSDADRHQLALSFRPRAPSRPAPALARPHHRSFAHRLSVTDLSPRRQRRLIAPVLGIREL
ncbi:hypothetical protein STTU_5073 [Streptomyces sp. Tu6071]|nr:hypothetical protein CAC01_23645 [Streptomyces sp. CLI2509]EFK99367.1 predicted protein [Streptomyces sp. SPB78]EGJ77862.1 hypothetical protein STTU_5073 [Streptomyces sp. Tu6071]MYQ61836.1 hypothetical protein [Streptomyces sp. SID4926]MYX22362.1 hypothetical protein [Streptomyces sp. SID8380]